MKQFEAERLHALQQGHDGVLPGAAPRRGARLELEVRQQVVGEHHELLPRTVGGVGLGRDAVEGQPGLELRDGLLVVAPPTGEAPHVADRQREVARDRRVFVVPIVRIKQVELIVLGGPVVDLLPIDGHGHGDVPGRLRARHGEAGHAGCHWHPGGTVPDVALQIQPAIERDFDGIAHAAALQPPQHILAEKRPIHAKPQPGPARAQPDQRRPQGPQERQARLPIVDVARPILDPQDVGRLGQVRHDRVVAGHLSAGAGCSPAPPVRPATPSTRRRRPHRPSRCAAPAWAAAGARRPR